MKIKKLKLFFITLIINNRTSLISSEATLWIQGIAGVAGIAGLILAIINNFQKLTTASFIPIIILIIIIITCGFLKFKLLKSLNLKSSEVPTQPSEKSMESSENIKVNKVSLNQFLNQDFINQFLHQNFSQQTILEYLNKSIQGQLKVKEQITYAIYNNFMKALNPNDIQWQNVDKINIMIIGPTGSGKTSFIRTLQSLYSDLDLPYVTIDATKLVRSGFPGQHLDDALNLLLAKANGDVEKAERGIIFIDEIDKKTITNDITNLHREVIQDELLHLSENNNVNFGANLLGKTTNKLNTGNITIVCLGNFNGLDKIINKRINKFSDGTNNPKNNENIFQQLKVEDLEEYGFKTEFISRFSTIAILYPLSKGEIINLLKNHSSINILKRLFKKRKIILNFEEDALEIIANFVINRKTGARGINNALNIISQNIIKFYESSKDGETIKITGNQIKTMLEIT
jgi:ATP-dependent Clp protease ATP-binding subunit ClpX